MRGDLIEDDALLVRSGAGDRAAFALLVERHRARLTSLVARILGDRGAAEEIVQETFTRAWREATRFRPPAGRPGAPAYLSRIAANLAFDQLRRPKTRPLEEAPESVDPAPSGEDHLIAKERREKLRATLMQLPPRQRAAIALAYDYELSNAEGAKALGVTVGAFELLLVRARRALRAAFSEEDA